MSSTDTRSDLLALLDSAERHVTALREEREGHWKEIAQLRERVKGLEFQAVVLRELLAAAQREERT